MRQMLAHPSQTHDAMNDTPRLRSAFPQTPQTGAARRLQNGTPAKASKSGSSLPSAPTASASDPDAAPFIPFHVVDAPTQRFYAFFIYGLLMAWRFYDWTTLITEDTESMWNFLKWTGIDAVFLFGLPAFRIPWLEWSTFTTSVLWFLHAVFNVMLMFRIGIPLNLWLAGLVKLVYDKELAINERNVKPADVIQNSSIILGKHIVTILPEGSAVMNPENQPFCLGPSIYSVNLPIKINQTKPIAMEITHVDWETMQEDRIVLSASNIKKMLKEASKHQRTTDGDDTPTLRYPVKKTGLYRLEKVTDESKLEVQTGISEAYVVNCPQARIMPTKPNRCRGDQSEVALEVNGTPPLKVTYRKMVNGADREVTIQSIQPEDFTSPVQKHPQSALIKPDHADLSWARSHTISVSLPENLKDSGTYAYAIDEVQDGLGNVIPYASQYETEDGKPKDMSLYQSLIVHERPKILLSGCDTEKPLQVAKGQSTVLPIRFQSTGRGPISDAAHTIEYVFTAQSDLSPAGDHGVSPEVYRTTVKNLQSAVLINKAGLYTLKSVSTEFCEGEVLEPASCVLENPPEPQLSFSQEDIFDKCAGNPIGLRINLDLIGTPPFTVQYTQQNGGVSQTHSVRINGLRGQIILTPHVAGHYSYKFLDISDAVYRNVRLKGQFEQNVKPSASAQFVDPMMVREACIDAPVQYQVRLHGESPWTLEYELVHGGRRTKRKAENIESEYFTIQTENLKAGGDYSVVLTSVTDRMGCKEFLKEQAGFKVRGERPKAYFGLIEGKRATRMLEGKKVQLPLRLTGKPKWKLTYRNLNDPEHILTEVLSNSNANLGIASEGTYELLSVQDDVCPGTIDGSGKQFSVEWIPRPRVSVHEGPAMRLAGGKYVKEPVCEGDVDSFDISLTGNPPFDIKYSETIHPDHGQKMVRNRELNAALASASIEADTAQAGLYQYQFSEVSDVNYDHDKKKHVPLVVEQRVHSRPNARFVHPGKTYSYCSREEDGEEVIPIILEGVPPFAVEVNIKHHGGRLGQPRTVTIPNIVSHNHELRIPHRVLELGNSVVSIRKVRDSRNCERTLDHASPRVQISVHDAPSITPLEARTDFCVGERLAYMLSGKVPFSVYYTFNNQARKASSPDTTFRRLAELPGNFAITGVSDSASQCKAATNLTTTIHPLPSVRISKGKSERVSIREGGETDILFEFTGTPPFEVTYTRSTNEKPGHRSKVLETRVAYSEGYALSVKASEEGTYEAVALRDKWCSFPSAVEGQRGKGQKLLKY